MQLTLNSLVLLHLASWGLEHHLFPSVLVLIDKFVQISVRILAERQCKCKSEKKPMFLHCSKIFKSCIANNAEGLDIKMLDPWALQFSTFIHWNKKALEQKNTCVVFTVCVVNKNLIELHLGISCSHVKRYISHLEWPLNSRSPSILSKENLTFYGWKRGGGGREVILRIWQEEKIGEMREMRGWWAW